MNSTSHNSEHSAESGGGKKVGGKVGEEAGDEGIEIQVPVKGAKVAGTPIVECESAKEKPKDTGNTFSSSASSGVASPGSAEQSSSSSSSLSHSNTSCSQDSLTADTVSLPATRSLATGMSTEGGRRASDPSLRVTAVLSGIEGGEEDKSELVSKLLEQVVALKMEVGRLEEENKKLQKVRTEVDDELHQLTENLFEEAYKMVDEAKGERATAEKRLADATGQIDAMETRMSALNNLLHTKTSSSSHLQPSTNKHHRRPSIKKLVRKIAKGRHSKSKLIQVVEHGSVMKGTQQLKEGELSSEDITEFHSWVEAGLPTTPPETHPYFEEVYRLDILPCLTFRNSELSHQVLHAAQNSTLLLESLATASTANAIDERPCSLTGDTSNPCSYRLRLQGSDQWHYISANSRNRIVTVCDFYTFVGYVQKGIIKKDDADLFWQVSRHRALIHIATLNLCLQDPTHSPGVH